MIRIGPWRNEKPTTLGDGTWLASVDETRRLSGPASGTAPGILTATNRQADDVMTVLRPANVRFVSLKDYDGKPVDAVKVGTVKRSKGLEFKQVLLAHVRGRLLAAARASMSEAERERRELGRRELYVGMTRARDGLWVGVCR